VDVWRIRLDLPVATVEILESVLSADEAQRAARFRFPADRQRYVVAHGCLRDILSRYLHSEPDSLSFSANQYGKPALKSHKLEFNLSHSGDFALVGVTLNRDIGVDVERFRTEMEIERIAHRFFSQNEVAELMSFSPEDRQIAFFNGWTRKEAYIKAHGIGLSHPLDSFDVSLSEPAILRAVRPHPGEAPRWTLLSLPVGLGYSGAVAVFGNNLKFRLWDWNSSRTFAPQSNMTMSNSKK
jgi:4'-phosphopantetheinyl transferase